MKRHFPGRTGLLVGAYGTAWPWARPPRPSPRTRSPRPPEPTAGGGRSACGRRSPWLAALPWLAVPAASAAARAVRAVRMRDLVHSRMAIALWSSSGCRRMQAYVIIGWSAQYLRDMGLSAAAAGLLLGLNPAVVIPINAPVPPLTVRPHLQRPLLLFFMACYAAGWIGLWVAPLTAPWLWMILLAVGLGTFAMVLTLMGLRARSPRRRRPSPPSSRAGATCCPAPDRCSSACCSGPPAVTRGCSSSCWPGSPDSPRAAGW